MLIKLAFRNVRCQAKDYVIYLSSIILNVVILFLFLSLRYNRMLMETIFQNDIKPKVLFQAGTLLITIFAFIFIWYAVNYLLRMRNREIGLYQLLGYEKKQVLELFVLELFLSVVICLVIGIILGALALHPLLICMNQMLLVTGVIYSRLSLHAILETIFLFFIITLLVIIGIERRLSKMELKEFFTDTNPVPPSLSYSKAGAIAGLVMLLAGYSFLLSIKGSSNFKVGILAGVVLCLFGTLSLYRNTLPFVGMHHRGQKNYRTIGSLMSTASLLGNLERNKRIWSILSLFIASTVAIILFGTSYAHTVSNMNQCMFPFTFNYVFQGQTTQKQIDQLMKKQKTCSVQGKNITETLMVNRDFDAKETLPTVLTHNKIRVISLQTLKQLISFSGQKKSIPELTDSQVMLMSWEAGNDSAVGHTISLQQGSKTVTLTFAATDHTNYLNLQNEYACLIVNNHCYDKLAKTATKESVIQYQNENPSMSLDLTIQMQQILGKQGKLYYAYQDASMLQISKVELLIVILVGLLFLSATGSILMFRQIDEISLQARDFSILDQLGVSHHQQCAVIHRLTFESFGYPCLLALCHITILICFMIHNNLIHSPLVAGASFLFFLLIYGFYGLMADKISIKALTQKERVVSYEE